MKMTMMGPRGPSGPGTGPHGPGPTQSQLRGPPGVVHMNHQNGIDHGPLGHGQGPPTQGHGPPP